MDPFVPGKRIDAATERPLARARSGRKIPSMEIVPPAAVPVVIMAAALAYSGFVIFAMLR